MATNGSKTAREKILDQKMQLAQILQQFNAVAPKLAEKQANDANNVKRSCFVVRIGEAGYTIYYTKDSEWVPYTICRSFKSTYVAYADKSDNVADVSEHKLDATLPFMRWILNQVMREAEAQGFLITFADRPAQTN